MTHRLYAAKYTTYSKIYVPFSQNIHDKSIVQDYSLKYNTLRLTLTNGEEVEIEGEIEEEVDLKYADNLDSWFKKCEIVKDVEKDQYTFHESCDCETYDDDGKCTTGDWKKFFLG